jgi:hypothetical protein
MIINSWRDAKNRRFYRKSIRQLFFDRLLVQHGGNKRKVGGVGFRPAKLCKRTTHSKSLKTSPYKLFDF